MPFAIQAALYLNPYRCDVCGCGVGLDGLVEHGSEKVGNSPPRPIWGRILCRKHTDMREPKG